MRRAIEFNAEGSTSWMVLRVGDKAEGSCPCSPSFRVGAREILVMISDVGRS